MNSRSVPWKPSCAQLRPRLPEDVAACARVLADVHARDGYPLHWPADPAQWLDRPRTLGAWVATLDERIVGHVALSRSAVDDAAPGVLARTASSDPDTTPAQAPEPDAEPGPAPDTDRVGGPASDPPPPPPPPALPDPGEDAADPSTAGPAAGVVSRLFVAPEARGHDFGRLLLAEVRRAAEWHGLVPVLDVSAADTAAVALYERLGWRRLATVEQEWRPGERVPVHCYRGPTG